MKVVKYPKFLTHEDLLDITLMIESKEIHKFAINYRASVEEVWHEIYRVDNYHGFLHEQKFWISPDPIPIKDKDGWPLQLVFNHYIDEVTDNFQRYRFYFEENMSKGKIKKKRRKDKNEIKNSKKRTERKGRINKKHSR